MMYNGYVRPVEFTDKLAARIDTILSAEKLGHTAVMEYEIDSLKNFLARDTYKETERIAEAARYWRKASKAHADAYSLFSQLSISGLEEKALEAGEIVKDLAERKNVCELWLNAEIDCDDTRFVYRTEILQAFADDEQAARDRDHADDQAMYDDLRHGG